MAERIKLCVLGGSSIGTPQLFESMGKLDAKCAFDVFLFGRNEKRLKKIAQISNSFIRSFPELDIQINSTTKIDIAVENADFVLNQIRVGGLDKQLFDEKFPRKFGIPGEESIGPSGFSNALRQIPLIMDICRVVENLAPRALLINLTNPSSILQYSIMHFSNVDVIGACDSPIYTINDASSVLNINQNDLQFDWFGMHHFGWLFEVLNDGKSNIKKVIENIHKIASVGVDPEIIQAYGAIPTPYLKYYFHPDRVLAATEGRKSNTEKLIELYDQIDQSLEKWTPKDPTEFITKRSAKWYANIVVPALIALSEKQTTELILSVKNDKLAPWLPEEAIIEAPIAIREGELKDARIPREIPDNIKAMILQNCTSEMLAAEAIVEKDRNKAIRSLQSNLLVKNFNQVRGILSEIWPGEEKFVAKVLTFEEKKDVSDSSSLLGFDVPTLFFNDKVIENIEILNEKFGIITSKTPWSLIKDRLPEVPEFVTFINELDWYHLESIEQSLPRVDAVISAGGGTATDAAKYFAWKRSIPIDAIPTVTSVDASVTKSIAARTGGHITYIGYIVPRNVYIDFSIIRNAPVRLNRSGLGDILCVHSALIDWKLAHHHTGEKYDENVVVQLNEWLDRIDLGADEIKQMTNKGIKLIMKAFEEISIICRKFGSSRPQEAADHTFAYNAEYQTGKSFLHGELVALGTYVIACLQENQPEKLRDIYKRAGIYWQPKDIGLTDEEFLKTLSTLNWYQKNFGRRYSILDEKLVSDDFSMEIAKGLEF